jgi:hypothetical protein
MSDRRRRRLEKYAVWPELELRLRQGESPESAEKAVRAGRPDQSVPSASSLRRWLKSQPPGYVVPIQTVEKVTKDVLAGSSRLVILDPHDERVQLVRQLKARIDHGIQTESSLPLLMPEVRANMDLLRKLLRDLEAAERTGNGNGNGHGAPPSDGQPVEDEDRVRSRWVHEMDSATFLAMVRHLFPAPPGTDVLPETTSCGRAWCVAAHAAGEKPCRMAPGYAPRPPLRIGTGQLTRPGA